MAKKKSKELINATKLADLLLYEITGGNLGTKPEKEIKNNVATFGEKRGFLDSMIKLADMKRKDSEGDEEDSAFDIIRKNTQKKEKPNGGGKSWGRGDIGIAPAESGSDESTNERELVGDSGQSGDDDQGAS